MGNSIPTFDDVTGKVSGSTALEWIALRTIQFGARLSAAWGYRGFGACCRILQKLVPGRELRIMLDEKCEFRIPFADPYWSMLLGRAEIYEPEIEGFLRAISSETYTLVDCGANYGYWSVIASGRRFGSQRAIAIEPSSETFAILAGNAALNDDRFTCIKSAVGAQRGVVRLSGHKHEARAVSPSEFATGETVEIIPLDTLIDNTTITQGAKVVIKLDVEGLEVAALAGCARLLKRDSIVICEDHGSDRQHSVSRHILENTPLRLFCHDPATHRFTRIVDISALDRIKRFRNRGYNVFATSSAYWEEKLQTCAFAEHLESDENRSDRNGSLIGALARRTLL